MELVKTAVDSITELLQKLSNEMAPTESCDSEHVAGGDGCGVKEKDEVRFTDDLRTEEFNYVMNESSKFNFFLSARFFHDTFVIFDRCASSSIAWQHCVSPWQRWSPTHHDLAVWGASCHHKALHSTSAFHHHH